MRPHIPRVAAVAASLVLIGALAACAPDPASDPTATPSASLVPSPTPIATITPDASATPEAATQIPEDCRSLLSSDVLAQLDGVPLNDPAFGASGSQPDGSLVCIWGDPAADTTGLTTTISSMSRGPALDMLNELADEQDFTCYSPDEGTRCEKTWENATYDVIDGRTLYWRNDVMIDTRYSNLAPSGYTDAIIANLYI